MAGPGIKAPFVKYDTIKDNANEFRQRLESFSLVFPIENIIESRLGMDIVPVRGLSGLIDMKGLLSQDLKTIYVDEFLCNCREEAYRFTLAHETGHRELHVDIYRRLEPWSSIAEWRDKITTVFSDEEHRRLEQQADMFAGLVLVPSKHLQEEYNRHVPEIIALLQEADRAAISSLPQENAQDILLDELCARIAPVFEVNPGVVNARLHYDKLKIEFFRTITPLLRGEAR